MGAPERRDGTVPSHRWPWQRRLQTRLILTYGLIFLAILVLLMLYVGRVVYRVQLDQAEHGMEVEAFLIANALEDPLSGYDTEFHEYEQYEREHEREADREDDEEHDEEDGDDRQDTGGLPAAPAALRLQQLAVWYARDTDTRVSILTGTGIVLADSHESAAIARNEADTVEVQAALSGREQHAVRIDPQSGVETLYVAAPVWQGDRPLGVVRLAAPLQEIRAPSQRLLRNLTIATVLALLAATLASIGLARYIVRPVRHLEAGATAVRGGDLAHTVPVETADELGSLARAFNQMTEQLSRLMEQQRLFIASASHELRTPLTNIKLRTEAIQSMDLTGDPVGRRYLAEIDREADRLGRMANVLLDLARLESTHRAPPDEPVNIVPIMHDLARDVRVRMQNAGLSFSAHLSETLPPIRVWPQDLEEIVNNLLDNAVKYTPPGGSVRLETDSDYTVCRIAVRDSGIGIAPEDIPHIFDRFFRVDKARSRKAGPGETGSGAGLGLAIVTTLVDRNQGRIAVHSDAGGTAFVVEFPLASSALSP